MDKQIVGQIGVKTESPAKRHSLLDTNNKYNIQYTGTAHLTRES